MRVDMAKRTVKKEPALKGVSAAERALAVLTAFRRGDGALSLAELAERTGLVKSTILRLALSLQQYRLLARLPDGSYRLDAETKPDDAQLEKRCGTGSPHMNVPAAAA